MRNTVHQHGGHLAWSAPTRVSEPHRLWSGDFDCIGGHYLQGITPDEVIIGVPFTERVRSVPAATVVLVGYNHPNRELPEYLEDIDGPWTTHLISDVTGTNGILPAIHQAAAVARAI